MNLSQLAQEILEHIDCLPKDEKLPLLVEIESQIVLEQLNEILKKLSLSQETITSPLLEPLLMLLSDRFDYIKGTDAIYNHTPFSHANRAFMFVAEKISPYCGEHPYCFLIPSIKNLEKNIQENLFQLKIHQFIFSDDEIPIDVEKCINTAAKNHTVDLFHTYQENKILSDVEKERVIHHSWEAFYYYDAIQYSINKHPILFDSHQEKFHDVLSREYIEIRTTYGSQSQERLLKHFFPNIDIDFDANRQKLIEMMVDRLPKTKWQLFLDEIGLDHLKKMILGRDDLSSCLLMDKYYYGNLIHDQAVLFCFTEIYWKEREKQGKYTSNIPGIIEHGDAFLGYYGNWVKKNIKKQVGGYDKNIKKEAVVVWESFLLSDHPLAEFDSYLEEHHIKGEIKSALFGGHLGKIIKQNKAVSHSNLEKKQENYFRL